MRARSVQLMTSWWVVGVWAALGITTGVISVVTVLQPSWYVRYSLIHAQQARGVSFQVVVSTVGPLGFCRLAAVDTSQVSHTIPRRHSTVITPPTSKTLDPYEGMTTTTTPPGTSQTPAVFTMSPELFPPSTASPGASQETRPTNVSLWELTPQGGLDTTLSLESDLKHTSSASSTVQGATEDAPVDGRQPFDVLRAFTSTDKDVTDEKQDTKDILLHVNGSYEEVVEQEKDNSSIPHFQEEKLVLSELGDVKKTQEMSEHETTITDVRNTTRYIQGGNTGQEVNNRIRMTIANIDTDVGGSAEHKNTTVKKNSRRKNRNRKRKKKNRRKKTKSRKQSLVSVGRRRGEFDEPNPSNRTSLQLTLDVAKLRSGNLKPGKAKKSSDQLVSGKIKSRSSRIQSSEAIARSDKLASGKAKKNSGQMVFEKATVTPSAEELFFAEFLVQQEQRKSYHDILAIDYRPRAPILLCSGVGVGVSAGSSAVWVLVGVVYGAAGVLQVIAGVASLALHAARTHARRYAFAVWVGNVQVAVVMSQGVALVLFPLGLGSPLARRECGGSSSVYWSGECSFGWSYMLGVVATTLAAYCPCLARLTIFRRYSLREWDSNFF